MYKPNFAGGNQHLMLSCIKGLPLGKSLSAMMMLSLFLFCSGGVSASHIENSDLSYLSVDCNPNVTIHNNGNCEVNIYHWLPAGDVFVGNVSAGHSITLNAAADGEKYRVTNVSPDWNNLTFDEHYMANGCHDQSFSVDPNYCTNSVVPPPSCNCTTGDWHWDNNITVDSKGDVSSSHGVMTGSGQDKIWINSGFPSEFNSPITINVSDAVSWDGYNGRPNSGDQPNEKWKLVFLKNGNVVGETPYTGDGIDTGVRSDFWRGSLGGTITLPNGFDEIVISHWGDEVYGNTKDNSANSVYPSCFCISYDSNIELPPAVSCPCPNSYNWDGEIELINGSYESGCKLLCGSKDQTPLINLPAAFHSGLMNIEIPEYVSADGYPNRASANQTAEIWKIEFYKNGSKVGETNSTQDVPDGQTHQWIVGSLNTTTLSNGADQFKIVQTGCGSGGAQSVLPSGVCFCKVDLSPECVINCPPSVTISCDESAEPSNTGTATAGGVNCDTPTITYHDDIDNSTCPQIITRTWTATGEQTSSTCFPELVAHWDFGNVEHLCSQGIAPLSSGVSASTVSNLACSTVSTSNVTGADNGSSCVQGAFGTPETAVCVQDQDDPSWTDNDDDAVHFDVSFNTGQAGTLTEFCFYERITSSNENFGNNNTPTQWGMRVLKNGIEIFQDIDHSTSAGSWTQHCFDFSSNNAFEYNGNTQFTFELLSYNPSTTNKKYRTIWELDDFKVYACCANSTTTPIVETCTQTITVEDTEDPVITGVPGPITVACNTFVPAVPNSVLATDNCSFDADFNEEVISGTEPCDYVIRRTWTATDDCNNSVSKSQDITVRDDVKPTASNPDPITVQCFSDIPAPNPNVVVGEDDSCSIPTVTFLNDNIISVPCDGQTTTIIRTYRVEDDCGNFVDVSQTINVDDTTNPTASNPAPINVECFSDIPAPNPNVVDDEADNCNGNPTVTHVSDDVTSAVCDGASVTVTRTYLVEDCAGNSITVSQTINVDDNEAPTGSAPADQDLQCFADVPAADINLVTGITDNCDINNDVTVRFLGDDVTSLVCDGGDADPSVVTRTYELEDCAGNKSTVTQRFLIEDTTAPTGDTKPTAALECFSDMPAADITEVINLDDNCSNDVTVTFISDDVTSVPCDGQPTTVTRTYRIEDCSGNTTDVTQTFNIADTTDPTASNPAPIEVECFNEIPAPDVTVVTDEADNCDVNDDLTVTFVDDDITSLVCDGGPETITRTYRVEDCAGNNIEVFQTITVEDVTAPVITGVEADGEHECNTDPVFSEPTTSDNCLGDVELTFEDTVDGFFTTRTWTATDCAGNETVVEQVMKEKPCMSIGSTVFIDDNNNGVQDADEEGISAKGKSVEITLIDADSGATVATTTTDSNGDYFFGNLKEGNYIVQFTPPATMPVSSTTTDTADNQQDGDDNGAQQDTDGDGLTDGLISSPVITLSEDSEPTGESFQGGDQDSGDDNNGDMTVDFGLVRLVSVGSTVFLDDNNNGIQDADELGLDAKGKTVTIELYNADTNALVATTTTDANGSYVFEGLLPGNYFISFDAPDSAPVSSTTDFAADDQVDGNDNGTQLDTDGDGQTDGTITSNVFYLEADTEPTNESGTNADKGSTEDDAADMTIDFGLVRLVSLGSTVFFDDNNNGIQDANENGLDSKGKSVTLELVDAATGDVVATTTTEANGSYLFDGLLPGDYIVQFEAPESAPVSSTTTSTSDDDVDGDDNGIQQDTDGDGLTDGLIQSPVITLGINDEPTNESGTNGGKDSGDDDNGNMTVDFGLVRLVSVGSTLFSDNNNNGIQDPNELTLGEKGKSVTLELVDAATGDVVATTTSDNNGSYIFENQLPGDYFIQFTPPDTAPVSSTTDSDQDDQVDGDDNGQQSDTDGDGQTDGQITSPVFNLTPSTEPVGETGSNGGKDDDADDNGDMTIDFGLVPLSSIGSTIFSDNNNNGIQDAGELTLGEKGKSITLELVDAATGDVIATTTTDDNGSYIFDGLLPGDYIVQFTPPASQPVSSTPTDTADNQEDGDDNGIQQDTDGDGLTDGLVQSPVINLLPGSEPVNEPGSNGGKDGDADENGDMTVDFGLVPLVSVGSTVFLDDNNNGIQDADEDGLDSKGKTVTLELVDAATGDVVATTTTTADGSYLFDNLLPGDYFIQFEAPDSAPVSSTTDSSSDDGVDGNDNGTQQDTDGDGQTDGLITSNVFSLLGDSEPTNESGTNGGKDGVNDDDGDMTIDFGLVRLVSVGSTVFSDDNDNGIQDANELTIGEKGKTVTLELFDAATGDLVATTTTDANGSYIFEDLLPGDYFIELTAPGTSPVSSTGGNTADDNVDGDDNGVQQDTDGDGVTDGVITSGVFNL